VNELAIGTSWWHPDRRTPERREWLPGSGVPFAALVAFTAILLLTPQTLIPALKTLRIALLAACLAIVVHMFDAAKRHQPAIPLCPEIVTTLALLCWTVLTIPFSFWPGGSVALLTDQYLKTIVFFWLIATLVTTRARLRTFAWALVLCAIPLAATGLHHFATGVYVTTGAAPIQRIAGLSGLTGNPNDLALTLNLLIPIAGALLITTRGIAARGLAAAAMLLCIPAVIVTFSRAGFLTLGTIVIASLIFFIKRRTPIAAAAVLVVVCAAYPLLPSGYIERLNTITDIEADPTGSAQGRWSDYQLAMQLVAANPMVGVGLGQDLLALDKLRSRPTWRSVHNAYLEYAVDLGLPGVLLFIGLLAASFRTARRVERRAAREPALRDLTVLASGVQIALLAFAVGAFFHPIAYQFYFFCVAGLAVAVKNVCRAELAAAHASCQS
jgi:probable O-glycosylation ligase (exosortase A-associated)